MIILNLVLYRKLFHVVYKSFYCILRSPFFPPSSFLTPLLRKDVYSDVIFILCSYDYAIGLLLLECSKMCCELFVCQLLLSYLTSVTCRISVYFVALRCLLTHLTFLLVNDRLSHFNCMVFVFMTVISPIFQDCSLFSVLSLNPSFACNCRNVSDLIIKV